MVFSFPDLNLCFSMEAKIHLGSQPVFAGFFTRLSNKLDAKGNFIFWSQVNKRLTNRIFIRKKIIFLSFFLAIFPLSCLWKNFYHYLKSKFSYYIGGQFEIYLQNSYIVAKINLGLEKVVNYMFSFSFTSFKIFFCDLKIWIPIY